CSVCRVLSFLFLRLRRPPWLTLFPYTTLFRSIEIDPWWFQNHDLFVDTMAHTKTLAGLEEEITRSRSKDPTIKKHFQKHNDDKRFPPSWKTLEQTSFGALSKLYGNLKHALKSKDIIAKELGAVNHTYLPSWL